MLFLRRDQINLSCPNTIAPLLILFALSLRIFNKSLHELFHVPNDNYSFSVLFYIGSNICSALYMSLVHAFFLHCRAILPGLVSLVGIEFRNSDEAWAFWPTYSGHKGFEVRKRYTNRRPTDGKVTSCRFVCANEGH